MADSNNHHDDWGHVSKCGGIPMYPYEYHFKIDDPVEMTEDHINARKKRLAEFLNQYGLELVEEKH